MRNICMSIVGFVILLSTVTFAENIYEIKSGTVSYVQNYGMGDVTVKHCWENYGNLMSYESKNLMKMPNGQSMSTHTTTIIDTEKNKSWTLDHKTKTVMEFDDVTEDENFSIPDTTEAKAIETKTVCGKKCKGFEVEGIQIWIWKGIVMKQLTNNEGVSVRMTATSISPGVVSKTEFSIPKDYKKQEDSMNNMMDALKSMGLQ